MYLNLNMVGAMHPKTTYIWNFQHWA